MVSAKDTLSGVAVNAPCEAPVPRVYTGRDSRDGQPVEPPHGAGRRGRGEHSRARQPAPRAGRCRERRSGRRVHRPRAGPLPPVRSHRPRPDAAGVGRPDALPGDQARLGQHRHADPDADRASRGVGQGARARQRRRRLSDQALRRARVDGSRPGAAAARSRSGERARGRGDEADRLQAHPRGPVTTKGHGGRS